MVSNHSSIRISSVISTIALTAMVLLAGCNNQQLSRLEENQQQMQASLRQLETQLSQNDREMAGRVDALAANQANLEQAALAKLDQIENATTLLGRGQSRINASIDQAQKETARMNAELVASIKADREKIDTQLRAVHNNLNDIAKAQDSDRRFAEQTLAAVETGHAQLAALEQLAQRAETEMAEKIAALEQRHTATRQMIESTEAALTEAVHLLADELNSGKADFAAALDRHNEQLTSSGQNTSEQITQLSQQLEELRDDQSALQQQMLAVRTEAEDLSRSLLEKVEDINSSVMQLTVQAEEKLQAEDATAKAS